MTERRGIFSFLVDVNPVAKLYKKLLGVSDVTALQFADEDRKRVTSSETASQAQVSETTKEVAPQKRPVNLTARQKYGDVDHAKRYGDYDAAHEIEKENRRNFRND